MNQPQFKIRWTEKTAAGPHTEEYLERDIEIVRHHWTQLVRAAYRDTVITVYNGAKLVACRTSSTEWSKL